MKEYKVWIRICIEEYDTIAETYRNVCKDEDTGIIEECATEELDEACIFKSDSYDETQAYINSNCKDL